MVVPSHPASRAPALVKMNTKRNLVLLGLAATLTSGTGLGLNAAEPAPPATLTPPPAPAAAEPAALIAKLVAVEKNKKSITLEIKGEVYTFKLSKALTVKVEGKETSVDSLMPNQVISVIARRSATGIFEIVGLDILPNTEPIAVAGPVRGPARADDKPAPKKGAGQAPSPSFNLPAPFRTEPNPANYSGSVVSPN